MSTVKIYDDISGIRIIIDGVVKRISKYTIKAIEVTNNRICIDTGQGLLNNLFIDYSDVTDPVTADIAALEEAIQAMMQSREEGLVTLLVGIQDELREIKLTLNGTTDRFKEPLRIDTNAGISFKGYSLQLDARNSDPLWAISQTMIIGSLTTVRWANGNQNFANIWDDRTMLTYLP